MDNDDLFKRINAEADIVKVVSSYIPVTKRGRNFMAVCPFHDDSNPSLSISPERNICHCFVCHSGGNPISFIQKYEHISFMEAARKAAEFAGIHDPRLNSQAEKKKEVDPRREEILKCLSDLTLYYSYSLSTKEGQDGLKYLESRHVDASMRNKYKLGYSLKDGHETIEFLKKKNHSLKTIEDTGITSLSSTSPIDHNHGRVVFPICDSEGNVIGFSARDIDHSSEAKYVNSPETYVFHKSNILYNYHIAKDVARQKKYVYLCEGFMDVFALGRIKEDAAVALMGTALTNEHIAMLRKLNCEIRFCLDGDAAGQKAMMKYCTILKKAGLNFRIVDNQGLNDDPDEIINNKGEDALKEYINNLLSYEDFIIHYFTRTVQLKTNEEKKELIKYFLPMLISLNDNIELDNYLRKLAKITGYEVETIREVVNSVKRRNQSSFNEQPNLDHYSIEDVAKEFSPERKQFRRLRLTEKEFLYQMISNKKAVDYYEKYVSSFYDDVYRQIANFIVAYAQNKNDINVSDLITALSASDLEHKEEFISTLTGIVLEKNHPLKCSEDYLSALKKSLDDEKERLFEQDLLERSLEGKNELEKALIIKEYAQRKAKELKNKGKN